MPEIGLSFFRQRLHKIHLKCEYLPELFSTCMLRLLDPYNNFYALYRSEYLIFARYLSDQGLDIDNVTTNEILGLLKTYNQGQSSEQKHLKLNLYFSSFYLSRFLLDPTRTSFDSDKSPVTLSGLTMLKESNQNCIVMHEDGSIYMHPKIRGDLAKGIFGVSHGSLAPGSNALAFSGSLVHTLTKGWILENTTGHYGTRVTQIRYFLEKLDALGLDISPLTLKLWIPNYSAKSGDAESRYTIIEENARTFLDRVSKNMRLLDELCPINIKRHNL